MVKIRKASTILIVLFAFSLLYPLLENTRNTYADNASRELSYIIKVDKVGNATVNIVFTSTGSGNFSIYLPKYEHIIMSVYNGEIEWLQNKSVGYWYFLATIRYYSFSDEITVVFKYNFSWASLMVDDRGWFMTPLIGTDNDIEVTVNVSFPNYRKHTYYCPSPIWESDGNFEFKIKNTLNGTRVIILYYLKEKIPEVVTTQEIKDMKVKVRTPPFYKSFAEKIISILKKSVPYLDYVFCGLPNNVEFRLFLPKDFPTTLGYVMGEDINVGGKGPVNINLALIRFMEGYLETTIIHEYTHLALGMIGVEANNELRWFHEGVAQYLSLIICEKAGVNVTDIKMSLDQGAMSLSPPFGYLQHWSTGPKQGLYYLASYKIVRDLAIRYGGMEFFRKFAIEAKKYGEIDTNEKLVKVLSKAAGKDLTPYFKNLGFQLIETNNEEESARDSIELKIVIGVLLVVVIALALYILLIEGHRREEYKVCPYCGAKIPSDAVYCPYCGISQRDYTYYQFRDIEEI